ncbi:MAG: hypothetical protein ACHQ50_06685 [Fimbriimonadales bacterium]
MKNVLRGFAILAALGSILPLALAAGNPKCSACKMELSSKKDKKHPVAVKIKGKTYYCCATCAMNKKAPGKPTPNKMPVPKTTKG